MEEKITLRREKKREKFYKIFEKLYPRLTEKQLDRLIILAEDMIFMKDYKDDSQKSA
jgi:hypothetical protein